MEKQERAVKLFNDGLNCSQSVLSAFLPMEGERNAELLRLACGFGAGIGRRQELCGAASGGVMAIGLALGSDAPEQIEKKERAYALTREFMRLFKERSGALDCRKLLGCDLATEEGHARYASERLRETVCAPCVRNAVELLEGLGIGL